MCSTPCKIRSTPCKICSTKQSYPQVIPRVIPKKVLHLQNMQCPPAKYAVPPAKYAVPHAKHAVPNKVIPKLSPELSPKRCYHPCKICSDPCKIHSIPCKIRSYPCKTCSTPCKIRSSYLQNTQYQTKLSPELSPMDLSKKNGLEK